MMVSPSPSRKWGQRDWVSAITEGERTRRWDHREQRDLKDKKLPPRGRGWGLYLRTGWVLNSEAALISPRPLPLRAASRTAYIVSGFRPTMVTMPSMLAVMKIRKGSQRRKSLLVKWYSCYGKQQGRSPQNETEHYHLIQQFHLWIYVQKNWKQGLE